MKIILNEIKKIFSLKMICILLILCAVLYVSFIRPVISVTPSSFDNDTVIIMEDLIKEYGNNITEKSLNKLEGIYKDNVEESDKIIKDNKLLENQNINSFDEYLVCLHKESKGENKKDLYCGLEKNELRQIWKTAAIKDILDTYNFKGKYIVSESHGQGYIDRINEIVQDGENKSIFFPDVLYKYNETISSFGMSILIFITVLLLPVFLRDKVSGVCSLQYTSKAGRNVFKKKIIAGILSAVLIATIGIIICLELFSLNGMSAFLSSNLNSALNDNKLWVSITFRGYIILTVVCIYILSIVTALITMFISNRSNRYVEGILVDSLFIFVMSYLTCGQVFPVLGAEHFTRAILLDNLFTMNNPKYLVPIMYIVLIAIAAGLTIYALKKEKVRDVLE